MSSSAAGAPDLSGLIELARDPQLDLKPVVLRVQTDLFLAAPIRDRAVLEAFRLLATGLIPTVDEDTAVIVARKLAPCRDTPDDVLACLAMRGGAVCGALLDAAPALSAGVLAAARDAGCAIEAPSAHLPEDEPAPADVPASRHDCASEAPAPEASAADDALGMIGWSEERRDPSLSELIEGARNDRQRASSLLAREDLADADLAPLWLHAGQEKRAAIRDAVETTAALRPCPPARRDLAATLSALSSERDVTGFVAALAQGIGVPADFLAAAPDASSRYDLLTLGLRAADLRDPEAIHIFLTLNESVARSVSRVFALAALYRSTSRAAARDLLSAIIGAPLPERTAAGEHRPYLAPDPARPRASAATERAPIRVIPTARTQRAV